MVSKNRQKVEKPMACSFYKPGQKQVTNTGNVGSVGVFKAAHLFTFGPRV